MLTFINFIGCVILAGCAALLWCGVYVVIKIIQEDFK